MIYQRLYETGGKKGVRVCALVFLLASATAFSYSIFQFVKANRIIMNENPALYRPMKKLRAALLKKNNNEDIIRELREMDSHIRQRYAAARVDALRYFRTGLIALFIAVVSARLIAFWRTRAPDVQTITSAGTSTRSARVAAALLGIIAFLLIGAGFLV
jgi:hypothetical protein